MILIKQKQLNNLYERFGLTETPQGNIQNFTEAQHEFMHILYRDYHVDGISYAQDCGIGFYSAPKGPIHMCPVVIDDVSKEEA